MTCLRHVAKMDGLEKGIDLLALRDKAMIEVFGRKVLRRMNVHDFDKEGVDEDQFASDQVLNLRIKDG